ncbi:hypothetical protein ACNGTO_03935 [Bisgaard Taxon 45]
MWESLIPAILKEIKNNFDSLLGGIIIWFTIFWVVWMLTPYEIKFFLQLETLPGLPSYTFFYITYFIFTTGIWSLVIAILNGITNWRIKIVKIDNASNDTSRVDK